MILISGHGVGVMALPLEASPEIEAAFQRIAQPGDIAEWGGSRDTIDVNRQHIGSRLTASLGLQSAGSGKSIPAPTRQKPLKPAELFRDGFFQVATAACSISISPTGVERTCLDGNPASLRRQSSFADRSICRVE
jgi:hypothetical protein